MTLLNHIGVFVLLTLVLYIVSIFEDRDLTFENMGISIAAAVIIMIFFEAFYWTFKIFF